MVTEHNALKQRVVVLEAKKVLGAEAKAKAKARAKAVKDVLAARLKYELATETLKALETEAL